MSQKVHSMHGRDHRPGGPDPIGPIGHVIEDEATPLPQRTNLDFVGAGVTATDDSANDKTVVTIPGAAATLPDAIAQLATSRDLRGYWRLGESSGDWADTSGYSPQADMQLQGGSVALTRHVTGAPTTDDDGAIRLNDSTGANSQSLGLGITTSKFSLEASDLTVAAFINRLGTDSSYRGIVGKMAVGGSGVGGWGLSTKSTGAPVFRRMASGHIAELAGPVPAVGDWMFVVGVYSTTWGHKLYIDGQLYAVDPATFTADGGNPLTIGLLNTFGSNTNLLSFYGSIDEVSVWASALTAEDVATLAGAAGIATSSAASAIASVTAAYSAQAGELVLANGTFTVTLPTAVGIATETLTVKNIGSGTITVGRTSSQTIDGSASNLTLLAGDARTFTSDGAGWWTRDRAVSTDATLATTDITTNNVSSSKHGFAPKSPADATKFLNGDTTPGYAQVKDSDLSTSDITTNNVSTTKHGFAPKAPNDTAQFLRGDGTWATVGGVTSVVSADTIWDAKGDIAAGTGADAASRLAVGADGTVLTADSAQTTGVKWAASATALDGWVDDTGETWTYASGSGGGTATFTVTGDATAKYTPGTRIKLTQTTVKYFNVIASAYSAPNTTVTITAGSDYTLANAAISANYHSYASVPQGWPGWFNYNCNPTGFSGTPTQSASKFIIVGRLCTFLVNVTGTSNASTFTVDSPFTMPIAFVYLAYVVDAGTAAVGRAVGSTAGVTVTFGKSVGSGGGFTASGTKQTNNTFQFGF